MRRGQPKAAPRGSPPPLGGLLAPPGTPIKSWGRQQAPPQVHLVLSLQLLGQLENTGPPPADKEKISSLPTVTVTQEQVGR